MPPPVQSKKNPCSSHYSGAAMRTHLAPQRHKRLYRVCLIAAVLLLLFLPLNDANKLCELDAAAAVRVQLQGRAVCSPAEPG